MNYPGSSPLVDDLQFYWKDQGTVVRDWAYGPFFARCCGTAVNKGKLLFIHKGLVRPRSLKLLTDDGEHRVAADSSAWFALGTYARQVTGT